jgi:hypothetical protein
MGGCAEAKSGYGATALKKVADNLDYVPIYYSATTVRRRVPTE